MQLYEIMGQMRMLIQQVCEGAVVQSVLRGSLVSKSALMSNVLGRESPFV